MPESAASIQKVNDFAQRVVERAQRNLGATRTVKGKKRRAVASGLLKDSLNFKVTSSRGVTRITFGAKGAASKYADVVEDGRRPGKFPPIDAIKKWMKIKPVRLRDLKTNSFTKVTESKLNSAAFLIARSISKKGIPGLKFFEDALNAELEETKDELVDSIAGDLIANITPVTR